MFGRGQRAERVAADAAGTGQRRAVLAGRRLWNTHTGQTQPLMPPVRVRDELYWLVEDCGTHKHTHAGQTQPLMPPVRVRDELYWLVEDCGTQGTYTRSVGVIRRRSVAHD